MTIENRGPELAAIAIFFVILCHIFVSMRLYARAVIMKSLGADDWLALGSLVAFTLYITFVLLGVHYGTGRHLTDISAENIPKAMKWWWLCEVAYVISSALTKVSICVFLRRICVTKFQLVAIWSVMSVITSYSIAYFFIFLFQCTPSSYFWGRYMGANGSCLPVKIVTDATYAYSAIAVWADWTLALLPVLLVWNLQMNPRTKVSVCVILAMGCVASSATIVRIPYLSALEDPDFLWATIGIAVWSTVELGIGITAAAAATLRPLLRNFLSRSRLLGSSTHGRGNSGAWSKPSRSGYVRNGGPSGTDGGESGEGPYAGGTEGLEGLGLDELRLRNDVGRGKSGVVTTICRSEGDSGKGKKEKKDRKEERVDRRGSGVGLGGLGRGRSSSERGLKAGAAGAWSGSESKLATDDSSEEWPPSGGGARWKGGIVMTTEVKTARDSGPGA